MFSWEEKNNYNYDGVFSIEEIEKLINELKEEQPSLIKKTPNMINENRDPVSRQKEEMKFNLLNELYVEPLIEFAKRISLNEGKTFVRVYNPSDSSIMERIVRLRNFLVGKGCQLETITKLVPKTVEEIDILLQASKLGFSLRLDNIADLTNDNRVARAKNYLALRTATIPSREVDNAGRTK